MPHFTKKLQTPTGLVTFYFNRIYTVNGVKYHVSVYGGWASHYFMMQEHGGDWNFADGTALPEWVLELRAELQRAIIDHLGGD